MLLDLVKLATRLLGDDFDIEIIEKHHHKKVDAPSGTAFMIANSINEERIDNIDYKYGRFGNQAKREKNEIGIHSVRGGTIPGEHTVIFAGDDEIIEIKHTALSKKIFAKQAIKAAKFIAYKEPKLYQTTSSASRCAGTARSTATSGSRAIPCSTTACARWPTG